MGGQLAETQPTSPKMDLGEQLIPKQWRNFGPPAEVSGLKGSSTPTLLLAEGVMEVPQPLVQRAGKCHASLSLLHPPAAP